MPILVASLSSFFHQKMNLAEACLKKQNSHTISITHSVCSWLLYSWLNIYYLTWKRSCEFAHLCHLQDLWNASSSVSSKEYISASPNPFPSPLNMQTSISSGQVILCNSEEKGDTCRCCRRSSLSLKIFFSWWSVTVRSPVVNWTTYPPGSSFLLFLFCKHIIRASNPLGITNCISLLPSTDCRLTPPSRRSGEQQIRGTRSPPPSPGSIMIHDDQKSTQIILFFPLLQNTRRDLQPVVLPW